MVTITRSLPVCCGPSCASRARPERASIGRVRPCFDRYRGAATCVRRSRGRRRVSAAGRFDTAAFVLPVEVLATIEGRTQEPVKLDASDPGRVVIRFAEHGVPQLLERTIDRTAQQPAWPELPATYAENATDLWPALRDAVDHDGPGTDPVCVELFATARSRRYRRHRRSSHLDPERLYVPLGRQLARSGKSVLGCKELDTVNRYVSA